MLRRFSAESPVPAKSMEREHYEGRASHRRVDGRALFVVPTYATNGESINAFMSTTVGMTSALRSWFKGVDVLTPAGFVSSSEERGSLTTARPLSSAIVHSVPQFVRVFLGDVRATARARRFIKTASDVASEHYDLVIQVHRRFVGAGQHIARASSAPYVLKVEAIETREERDWGVRRPGWARLAEWLGERRLFEKADLLLPISTELDAQLESMGIPAHKRVVVPSGVDPALFAPGPVDAELAREHHLQQARPRVGWVGGFRPFHGLELLPDFADRLHADFPDAILYLIGAGPLRRNVERSMSSRSWVRLPGAVPHDQVSRWLRCFDVAILPSTAREFHYSPLKLYEYLACGAPVVAAGVGDIAQELVHKQDAFLVPPGNADALADGVLAVLTTPGLRQHLALSGRRKAESEFSWQARAALLMQAVLDRGLLPALEQAR